MKRSRKKVTSGDGWSFASSCRACDRPKAECVCHVQGSAGGQITAVRLRLEKRRGKPVTVANGAEWPTDTLRELLKELKSLCATGGALKGQEIELQGDHRERLRELLVSRGVRVKG
jgi:translation initiation factor 1